MNIQSPESPLEQVNRYYPIAFRYFFNISSNKLLASMGIDEYIPSVAQLLVGIHLILCCRRRFWRQPQRPLRPADIFPLNWKKKENHRGPPSRGPAASLRRAMTFWGSSIPRVPGTGWSIQAPSFSAGCQQEKHLIMSPVLGQMARHFFPFAPRGMKLPDKDVFSPLFSTLSWRPSRNSLMFNHFKLSMLLS